MTTRSDTDRDERWALVLVGGDGQRLRPLTRIIAGDERPKQFCRILSRQTLLEATERRVAAYSGLGLIGFSDAVLAARPANLATLPVHGVRWSDWGHPRRVMATFGELGIEPEWAERFSRNDRTERTKNMRKTCTIAIVAALLSVPSLVSAADKCPTELSEAKAMLSKATAASTKKSTPTSQAPRQLAGAKAQDIQAPRAQDVQAPRAQDVQAPRAQDVQAPRAQDVQAPRAQDVQAPRAQDVQAPRAQDIQAPRAQAPKGSDAPPDIQVPRGPDTKARLDNARKLISESEAACKKGDMTTSASKAKQAMGLLK
jgi:hypothetical protein